MDRNPKTFSIALSIALVFGYTWAFLSSHFSEPLQQLWKGCLMKQFFHIPCPSCGTTRSVISLLGGDLEQAFYWNPIGILLGLLMVFLPFLLAYDGWKGETQTWNLYQKSLRLLKRKPIWVSAAVLLALNWFWNFCKGY